MKEQIITILKEQNKLSLKQLQKKCQISSSQQLVQLMKTLNQLEDERLIFNNHSYYYLLNQDDVVGKVKDISKYEFAVIGQKKVYVEKKNNSSVLENDEVLAQKGKNGQYKITHIYNHGIYRISGTFIKRKNELVFHSDMNFHREFFVKNRKNFKIEPNQKAIVTIEEYGNPMVVNIEKLLGNCKNAGVDITAILLQNRVRLSFPDSALLQAKQTPQKVSQKEMKTRKDLRFLQTITIDGDDARDFDDAVSIIENEEGFSLFVHIADVSHYVKENSALDQEAYQRCTSIYVADRVVPMLPLELSNGICSLNEAVERNTITCQMQIDRQGNIVEYQVYPSVIFSDKRCTYQKVNRALQQDPEVLAEYQTIYPMLQQMARCAQLLMVQSQNRGNIEFSSKEPVFILDKKGRPVDIQIRKTSLAEQMIEQFMIAANVCVATLMNQYHYPCMYRIHEDPDDQDLEKLAHVAQHFHLEFEQKKIDSKKISELLERIDDEMVYDVVSNVALRCMQKARYSHECLGHFGLSLENYCHFTSPIRRYSDLVVHRCLRKYVFERNETNWAKDMKKVEKQALQMSQKEKEAILVERKVEDYLMAEYMENKMNEVFEAKIVSVLEFGFFVQLDNLVEGLVSVRSLDGFFSYDEKNMCLTNSLITYSMGQKLKVVCVDVNKQKGQIAFELVNKRRKDRR